MTRQRDDEWFVLASNEFGVAESVIRCYAAYGDNLSLAILTHITCCTSARSTRPNRSGVHHKSAPARLKTTPHSNAAALKDFGGLINSIIRYITRLPSTFYFTPARRKHKRGHFPFS